ncbi:Prenylcysteine oxidase-like [Perkinsus chesapeaki]|uniref:Prenylcysteine oxidase-like n=1 Tax=Perkinsus chesapeaki TaxID=330153 RepID=A0A7J6L0Y4_PERCH|nr:Prenylcysteine oxidase-like [Perkinsus chesapeaki]
MTPCLRVSRFTDKIGGRARSIEFDGRKYEAGASVIHKANQYFVAFCEKFGLERRRVVLSGTGMAFRGSTSDKLFRLSGSKLKDSLSIILRYGVFNLLKLKRTVAKCVDKFGLVYDRQCRGTWYSSPVEMLESLGDPDDNLAQMLGLSVDDYLVNHCGIDEMLVKELVNAGTRCNYRQAGRSLNAFCGTVSMAGTDSHALFSVVGGNDQVPQKCIEHSGAKVLSGCRVSKIEVLQRMQSAGNIRIYYNTSEARDYDAVIVACPLEFNRIEFAGSRDARKAVNLLTAESHTMCRTVCHYVKGRLRADVIDRPVNLAGVLSYEPDESIPWTAIGLQIPVDANQEETQIIKAQLSRGEETVFKIFAERPLTASEIGAMLEQSKPLDLAVQDWQTGAYPMYHVGDTLLPFDLGGGIFTTSPMERAASALETVCISGRNAALLVREHLIQQELAERTTSS